MALFIPNILGADVFYVQADARDSRFTWKREGGKDVPGLIIAGKPSLRFPLPGAPDAASLRDAINSAASQDDAMAWGFAARWWISYAWERYTEAGPDGVWQQLDWAGAKNPDQLPPMLQSLVNGRTMGGYEILAGKPWLLTDTWTQYFVSLIAQVALKVVQLDVATLIEIQMAMRSVSWWMASMISGTAVQCLLVDSCQISGAWNSAPTIQCQLSPYLSTLNKMLVDTPTAAKATTFEETAANFYKGLRTAVDQGKLTRRQGFYYLDELLRLEEQWSISCDDCEGRAKNPVSSPSGGSYRDLFTQLYDDYQSTWRPGENGNPE